MLTREVPTLAPTPHLRILLDCDGVLADFISRMLETVARVTGRVHSPDQVTKFDFCAALGLTYDEARAVKKGIGETAGFCSSIRPYPDARHGVRALRELGEVYVVTAPWNSSPTWMSERESWLERHFSIPHSHVIHCSCKQLISGDVFVDDKASAVDAWKLAHVGLAVHWKNLHNRTEPSRWGYPCSDWSSLVALVERTKECLA